MNKNFLDSWKEPYNFPPAFQSGHTSEPGCQLRSKRDMIQLLPRAVAIVLPVWRVRQFYKEALSLRASSMKWTCMLESLPNPCTLLEVAPPSTFPWESVCEELLSIVQDTGLARARPA